MEDWMNQTTPTPEEPQQTPPNPAPQEPTNQPTPPKKSKKKLGLLIGGILLYAGLFLALLLVIALKDVAPPAGAEPNQNQTQTENKTEDRETYPPIQTEETGELPIVGEGYTGATLHPSDLYEQNVGAVVFVKAQLKNGKVSGGSGFVIDSENGYLLTNQHVVDGATEIAVSFANGASYSAQLIGGDEINDVAVLKVDVEGLPHVTIGKSSEIRVGEDVLIIGNPLGSLTFTLTRGIVSGKERIINTGNYDITTFQTDAAINSGNSGGPAFDATGAVIGIASAKYSASGVEGICFCIPIDDAMEIARDLVNYGYVKGRPNLGVSVSTSSGYRYELDSYGRRVMVATARGALIDEINSSGCAYKAGLRKGDIVTKINSVTITTGEQLINEKNRYPAGTEITMEVYRSGETFTIKVVLDEYTPS